MTYTPPFDSIDQQDYHGECPECEEIMLFEEDPEGVTATCVNPECDRCPEEEG